jgi:hypothetical protein
MKDEQAPGLDDLPVPAKATGNSDEHEFPGDDATELRRAKSDDGLATTTTTTTAKRTSTTTRQNPPSFAQSEFHMVCIYVGLLARSHTAFIQQR